MVLVATNTMFVNGIEILLSIFRYVKFTIVQYIGKRTMGNISKPLENINDVYYIHRMYVETLYMDRGFENHRKIMPGRSTLSMTTEADHIPEIERQTRVKN